MTNLSKAKISCKSWACTRVVSCHLSEICAKYQRDTSNISLHFQREHRGSELRQEENSLDDELKSEKNTFERGKETEIKTEDVILKGLFY